jgi:hypothetical protein
VRGSAVQSASRLTAFELQYEPHLVVRGDDAARAVQEPLETQRPDRELPPALLGARKERARLPRRPARAARAGHAARAARGRRRTRMYGGSRRHRGQHDVGAEASHGDLSEGGGGGYGTE